MLSALIRLVVVAKNKAVLSLSRWRTSSIRCLTPVWVCPGDHDAAREFLKRTRELTSACDSSADSCRAVAESEQLVLEAMLSWRQPASTATQRLQVPSGSIRDEWVTWPGVTTHQMTR